MTTNYLVWRNYIEAIHCGPFKKHASSGVTWWVLFDCDQADQGPESAIPALERMTDCISDMPPAPQCSIMQGMISESCPGCERSYWRNPRQRSRGISEGGLWTYGLHKGCLTAYSAWTAGRVQHIYIYIYQLVEHRWSQAMGPWFESRWCSWFFHSNIFPCNLWKNWFLQIPLTLIIYITLIVVLYTFIPRTEQIRFAKKSLGYWTKNGKKVAEVSGNQLILYKKNIRIVFIFQWFSTLWNYATSSAV